MTHPDNPPPTLKDKMIAGANHGMLAGFWAELPILTFFAFKSTSQAYWNGLRSWSARLILPVTLGGLIYGWTKPDRQYRHQQEVQANHAASIPLSPVSEAPPKSWVATERAKAELPAKEPMRG